MITCQDGRGEAADMNGVRKYFDVYKLTSCAVDLLQGRQRIQR